MVASIGCSAQVLSESTAEEAKELSGEPGITLLEPPDVRTPTEALPLVTCVTAAMLKSSTRSLSTTR